MDLMYSAGPRALTVDALGRSVERGETVTDVPEPLAKQLLAQGWEQVTPVAKATRPSAPKKESKVNE